MTQTSPVVRGRVALFIYLYSILSLVIVHTSSYNPWIVVSCATMPFVVLIPTRLWALAKETFPSYGLGLVFGAGLLLVVHSYTLPFLGVYLIGLSFFHFSEYFLTAMYNGNTLTIHSFLIDHSPEYSIAAIASWVEFGVEFWLFPDLKTSHPYISMVGFVMVAGGEFLRKVAMIQAKSNFTHTVMHRKRAEHCLVTTGLYGWFRHPSYVGWFYWSIGTQVLLLNPVCCVGYAVASWKFFSERVYSEEQFLIEFFKQEYVDYKKKVWSGLPYIDGVPLDEIRAAFPASDLNVDVQKKK